MPTLRQCLESLPHRDVRGIATRLGLRQRSEHRKIIWIDAIVAAWQEPNRAACFVAALSPAALSAAQRLAQAGEVPAALFLADATRGGVIRHPRRGRHWMPPPWAAPHSVAEELYYSGLLAPIPATLVEKASRLAVPADLQALFRLGPALPVPAIDAPITDHNRADDSQTAPMQPSRLREPASDLLHDVAQVLCFLIDLAADGRTPILLHDRWLAPAALVRLNQRLLRPERASPLRAHRQAPQLRFLFFLTAAAGLQVAGALTPRGWAWLAEPSAARLASLWHAWRAAPLDLREVYRQPSAALPPPWPDLALKYLTDLPSGFTAAALAQRVLGQETTYTAYFTAHLADIGALDAAAAGLLETLASDWGALVLTEPSLAPPTDPPDLPPGYALTPLGRWLVDGTASAPISVEIVTASRDAAPAGIELAPAGIEIVPASIELTATSAAAAPNAEVHALAAGGWRVTVSPDVAPLWLADLAVYARHEELARDAAPHGMRPGPRHVYRLDETTVAAASAAGHALPRLLQALAGLGVQLTSEQQMTLQAWHDRGRELQLTVVPLLHAARPQLLAQLLSHADVRAGLGDLLSPTTAVVALPPDEFAARLRAAGFYPQGPAIRNRETEVSGHEPAQPSTPVADPPSASSTRMPSAPGNPQSALPNPTPLRSGDYSPHSLAVLWLAGQLYAAVGEHVPLPLPPPFADLTALLATLPPLQQAVVQAQWETLRAAFLAALDGQTYAPPPQPSDPQRWRPLIDAAVAAGRPLTMRYFTAGRNVVTERTVTPYWIEERHGIPYLRADCHLAGRVRLFRLDRIQDLTIPDGP